MRLVRGWDRFWFLPADPTLLGFLRICAGLVTLYIHIAYTFDLQAFLGKNAWLDLKTINAYRFEHPWPLVLDSWDVPQAQQRLLEVKGYPAWSIWFSVTDPHWMMAIHIGVLIVIFLFTIGFCTRVTSVLTWLAAMSYIQRAMTTLFGLDTMMNLVLLYLMIGPSGAALSVDRLIARYRSARRALREHRPPPLDEVRPQVSARLALRLIQVNLCVIYFVAGLSKLQGQSWWSFTAVWYTMANPEFSPLHTGPYVAFLHFLCDRRPLWELVMTGGVLFTFWVELGFPSLVWRPSTRWLMIASALAMHTGICMTMKLTTFSLMMMIMVLSFVPEETVRRLFRRRSSRLDEMVLRLDSRRRGQSRAAALVHAFDAWRHVEIEDVAPAGSTEELLPGSVDVRAGTRAPRSLELVLPDGTILRGSLIFERLSRKLPLLWPVGILTYLPPVRRLLARWFPPAEMTAPRALAEEGARRILQGEKVAR